MESKRRMLVVDDMEVNRAVLKELFEDEYEVTEAQDGFECVDILRTHAEDISMVLLDIIMPRMDGYDVLRFMQKEGLIRKIPVVVITVMDDITSEVKTLDLGATDWIVKPFEPSAVRARVKNVMDAHLYKMQMEATIRMQDSLLNKSYKSMMDTLKSIIAHKNMQPGNHVIRLRDYTVILLGEVRRCFPELGIDEDSIDLVSRAAMLHDVGKIAIPDRILNKPDKLSATEYELVKTHTTEGPNVLSILDQISNENFLHCVRDICRHHHERWDGTGYPDKLRSDQISINAQIVGIVDAYDALTRDRSYQEAYPHEKAVDMIVKGECGAFSPDMISCFVSVAPLFYAIETEADNAGIDASEDMIIDMLAEEFGKLKAVSADAAMDSYKYHALLGFMEACVYEIDVHSNLYRQIDPGSLEFTMLPPTDSIEAFLSLIARDISPKTRPDFIKWMKNGLKQVLSRDAVVMTANYEIYNHIHDRMVWYRVSIVPVPDGMQTGNGALFILKNVQSEMDAQKTTPMLQSDIIRYQAENAELKIMAEVDQLTGLYNKMTTHQLMNEVLSAGGNTMHGLLILDMDDFKHVNDTLGHLAGDRCLRDFAKLLKKYFRDTDIIGRIGGDEFAVLMTGIPGAGLLEIKARKLISDFQSMIATELGDASVAVSVGGAVYPSHGLDFNTLFERADQALYAAKSFGKRQFRLYSSVTESLRDAGTRVPRRTRMEGVFSEKQTFNKLLPSHLGNTGESISEAIDLVARNYGLFSIVAIDVQEKNVLLRWCAYPAGERPEREIGDVLMILEHSELYEPGGRMIRVSDASNTSGEVGAALQAQGATAGMVVLANISEQDGDVALAISTDAGVHEWTPEEQEAAVMLAEKIAEWQKNMRTDYRLHLSETLLDELIVRFGKKSYVVNSRFEVMQRQTRKPSGEKCYHERYGRDSICENCPVVHAPGEGSGTSVVCFKGSDRQPFYMVLSPEEK